MPNLMHPTCFQFRKHGFMDKKLFLLISLRPEFVVTNIKITKLINALIGGILRQNSLLPKFAIFVVVSGFFAVSIYSSSMSIVSAYPIGFGNMNCHIDKEGNSGICCWDTNPIVCYNCTLQENGKWDCVKINMSAPPPALKDAIVKAHVILYFYLDSYWCLSSRFSTKRNNRGRYRTELFVCRKMGFSWHRPWSVS